MDKKLSFKDYLAVDYAPGMPDQIKYNAKKRKYSPDYASTNPPRSDDDVDEALTMQQRRARARLLKRYKSRIKMGREKAKRRFASPEKLKSRARKAARMLVFKKISKDIPKADLTFARRQEIEKRLEKPAMKKKIDRLAKKLLPKTRKAEMEKKRGSTST
tara:strand:+ start:846 stop:1325 length:480 start_codon:yes stop_codon:yes gene_type:complete